MLSTMPILSVRHVTTYRYRQPVAFGEHRMMLLPRDDDDQRVLHSELTITPAPKALTWTRDRFGNHVAIALFADHAEKLRVVSTIRLAHAPADFRDADIADFARTYPFAYAAEERAGLERFMQPLSRHAELGRWSAKFFRDDGSADTHALLVDMTRTMRRSFKHVARHEKGVQDPVLTLDRGSGSCRDLAVLMIAALRLRGIAARFVSGYLHLTDDEDDGDDSGEDAITGGNTHAWVQVYVPGPGWVDFDPSGGRIGNRNLIRVAVAPDPREAIPLQGTWYGSASDHLAMEVAVKVRAAAIEGTFTSPFS
jgi:transglutaminase-like putative cysteine protease